jgi:acetyl esterase
MALTSPYLRIMNNRRTYPIDPELKALNVLGFKQFSHARIHSMNVFLRIMVFFSALSFRYKVKSFRIGNKRHIKVRHFRKRGIQQPQPCVIFIHGGAFKFEGTPMHIRQIKTIVEETGYSVLDVRYRLALKHPFPSGLEDCYEALLWLEQNRKALRVAQIYVYGDSAGGNLATALTLLARDRKGPKIAKQVLIYPVIDHEQKTDSIKKYVDTPVWNSVHNKVMWEDYLREGTKGMLPYASPNRADLKGLPPAYVETAEFDCLRDEAKDYAKALKAASVHVEENHTKATVHGFDLIKRARVTREAIDARIRFLKS